jgi:hypothetical protein
MLKIAILRFDLLSLEDWKQVLRRGHTALAFSLNLDNKQIHFFLLNLNKTCNFCNL